MVAEVALTPSLGRVVSGLIGKDRHYHASLPVKQKFPVEDTRKILIRTDGGLRAFVLIISTSHAPDAVRDSIQKARLAASVLSASIAERILVPVEEGEDLGLSFAIYPYCFRISERRVIRKLQKTFIRRRILEWLGEVTRQSLTPSAQSSIMSEVVEPLERLSAVEPLSARLRAAALTAASRAARGDWKPQRVLVHNDLWTGNILFRSKLSFDLPSWANKFVIIDWQGSERSGFGIYDLIRFAVSTQVPARTLRQNLQLHAGILGCDIQDTSSYLLAALANINLHLNNMPPQLFAATADECYSLLVKNLLR